MKCILHIGTAKTGTTSLQRFFDHNADRMKKRGVYYSECLGRPNNLNITLYAISQKSDLDERMIRMTAAMKKAGGLRQTVQKDLAKEIKAIKAVDPDATYVISNEHLHSRLTKPAEIARVRALLSEHFDEIEVYCFVRPQADLLLSRLSTQARGGHPIRPQTFTAISGDIYFNYDMLYRLWKGSFDNLTFVPYARHRSIVTYFLDLLGLDMAELEQPAVENTALDFATIALLNVLNSQIDGVTIDRQMRRIYLDDLPVETRLTVNRNTAQNVQARFNDSNAALAALCGTVTPDDLTPDWSRYPETGNIHELDQMIGQRQIRYVIARLNAETWIERARTKLAETTLSLAQNEPAKAEKELELATKCLRKAAKAEIAQIAGDLDQMRGRIKKLQARIKAAPETG